MDASARVTMKDAAKCDKHCELQNSVNQQNFERILHFRDIPESMSASESPQYPAHPAPLGLGRSCAPVLSEALTHQANRVFSAAHRHGALLTQSIVWRRSEFSPPQLEA